MPYAIPGFYWLLFGYNIFITGKVNLSPFNIGFGNINFIIEPTHDKGPTILEIIQRNFLNLPSKPLYQKSLYNSDPSEELSNWIK